MATITFEDVKRVSAHGLWKKSRGKNPSLRLGKEKNPKLAFEKAFRMSKEFNRNFHPERQPDEVYITTCDDDCFHDEEDGIGWTTKRQGEVGYYDDGQEMERPNFSRAHVQEHILDSLNFPRPVFVKRAEIEARARVDYNVKDVLKRLEPEMV